MNGLGFDTSIMVRSRPLKQFDQVNIPSYLSLCNKFVIITTTYICFLHVPVLAQLIIFPSMQQMAELVAESMESKGTRFLRKCVPVSIEKDDRRRLVVKYKDLTNRQTKEEVFDTVMFATG